MCAVAGWTSIRIAAWPLQAGTTGGWYASKKNPGHCAGIFYALDAHIGQALQDVAQSAGDCRVFHLEAFYRQVDPVNQRCVWWVDAGAGQLLFDLLQQGGEGCPVVIAQRW